MFAESKTVTITLSGHADKNVTYKSASTPAGTATITASRPADNYYNAAAPVSNTITVQRDNKTTSNTVKFGYQGSGSDVDIIDLSAKANASASVGGVGGITMTVKGSVTSNANGAVTQAPIKEDNTTVNRLKFQIGTSFTISSTSNNITKIEYTVVYSSNRDFDFDGKKSLYTWEGTEAKSSVTFTNSSTGNIYITRVTVTYTTALGDGTYNTVQTPDYTWTFTKDGSLWNSSIIQLNKYSDAGIVWNHVTDKDRDEYWILNAPETATGYDVDIIRGLRFTGSFDVDPKNHIVYLAKDASVMIPGAAKDQRFSITYANNNNGQNGQLNNTNLTQAGESKVDKNGVTESDYTVTDDGNVTFTSTNGTWLYNISWLQPKYSEAASFKYDDIAKTSDTNPRYKVYLSSAGSIPGGLQITNIPGMIFQFGKKDDSWTSSYIMDAPLASSSAVQVNSDYVPTSGTYYTFMPNVNGVVTATVLGWGGHQIYLKEDGGDLMAFDKITTTGMCNDISFSVTAGKTYYMYSDAIGKQEYQLYLNGFDFEPSFFILNDKGNYVRVMDGQSIGTSTMGETFMIPFIMTSGQNTKTAQASVTSTGPGKDYVSVNDLGNVTIVQPTEKKTTVTCTITNSTQTKWKEVTLSYVIDGVLANSEAWVVDSGYKPKIGEEITSIDGIKMTFGGWKQNNDSTYKYNSKDKTDKWSAADGDAAARDENNLLTHSLDGFLYATSGAQDGKSETLGNSEGKASDHGFFEEGNKNSIPVRGAYAMFEPTKNGTLSIYILQNGCITNHIKDAKTPATNSLWKGAIGDFNGEVAWRPFYIVDEAGHSVTDVTYKVNNTLKMNYSDIEGIVASHTEAPKDKYKSIEKYDDGLVYYYINPSTGARAALDETRRTALINQWKSEENNKDSVKVLAYPDKNGTSYLVTGKSYVKYEFPVQAGKSYFIFSNSSKLGLCGFKFHVTDNNSEPVAISLDNKVDPYNAVTDKYANVTLAGRTFTKDRWTTLCLPFAVSATQMRQTFGDNVQLIEFDKTVLIGQKDTTANGKEETFNKNTILLKNHVNNQLVATGVPYLIKPSNDIDAGKAVINYVYFPATPVEPQVVNVGNGYKWKGVFENETLGNGDYYISGKDGSFKYYTSGIHDSNSFRCYLDRTDNGSSAKPIVFSAISFGSAIDDPTTTGIGEIKAADIDATTINTGKIYNINGQVVSNNSTDLNSLPKGIYIVNGKKYVVK